MGQPNGYTLERDAPSMSCSARSPGGGYTILGPTVRDRAIVYDEIAASADLPVGWTDEQDGGHYRLRRRDDEALFGYNVGPHSWKRYQLPAEVRLWRARRDERRRPGRARRGAARGAALRVPRRALVRAARDGDPRPGAARRRSPRSGDRARREDVFVVAVQCGAGRRHLLLRLDGHRPDGRAAASTSR